MYFIITCHKQTFFFASNVHLTDGWFVLENSNTGEKNPSQKKICQLTES